MNNTAVIAKIRNIKSIPGCDNINVGNVFESNIIISKNIQENALGVYFDDNVAISKDFLYNNNLYRESTLNKNTTETGFFDENGRVRCLKLRGVKSDAFWIPLESLEFTKYDISKLKEGFEFNELNDIKICEKYISKKTRQQGSGKGKNKKESKFRVPLTVFPENPDTEQLAKHLHDIPNNKIIIISEKIHGTSWRRGNVKIIKSLNWWQNLLYKLGIKVDTSEYKDIVGSRRVVKTDLIAKRDISFEQYWIYKRLDLKKTWLKEFYKYYFKIDIAEELYRDIFSLYNDDSSIYNNFNFYENKLNIPKDIYKNWIYDNYYNSNTGFYKTDIWTEATTCLAGKLHTNEIIYGEIAGYLDNNSLVMGLYDNKKMGKDFIKKYGEKTAFTYGADIGQYKLFVYRITLSNGDGFEIDYSWENLKQRCQELGVEHVPELLILNSSEFYDNKRKFMEKIEELVQGCSTVDPTHIREGVCVRIDDGLNMKVFKHKSFEYKMLEGLIKDNENFVDLEELQSSENDNLKN